MRSLSTCISNALHYSTPLHFTSLHSTSLHFTLLHSTQTPSIILIINFHPQTPSPPSHPLKPHGVAYPTSNHHSTIHAPSAATTTSYTVVLSHQTFAHCETSNPTAPSLTINRTKDQLLLPSFFLSPLDNNFICFSVPNPLHVKMLLCSTVRGHAKGEESRHFSFHVMRNDLQCGQVCGENMKQ